MAIPGQRFRINMGAEFDSSANQTAGLNLGLVGDIKERAASSGPKPPSPPRLKSSGTGFPAHRIRTGLSSSRKGRENQPANASAQFKADEATREPPSQPALATNHRSGGTTSAPSIKENEVLGDPSIDHENKQRLAQMSDEEIEEARRELMAGLSPSLIEKLLKKADIDEGRADTGVEMEGDGEPSSARVEESAKRVKLEGSAPPPASAPQVQDKEQYWDPEGPPLEPPRDLQPASSYPSSLPQPPNIHFPNPPQAPDLDPSDPDFLSALHTTYFPKLPADPSTMAWMTPLSSKAEEESAYSPTQGSHPVSALRFDFRGHLLPPRLSAQIPSTKGLHHHAHAPASAGYTVPELSHLSRSSYPAQRCIAYQTLGRILYRLGRGDFGQEGEDLCEGLWQLMDQGKVVDQLVEAAAKENSGNRSTWVIATEAVWLWRKGGGRRWKGR